MTIRVGITGLGMITPLGIDTDTTWKAICQGHSGAGPIRRFDPSCHPVRIAAEVKDFDPATYLDRKEVRRTERFVQYAYAAACQAVADAGLNIEAMPDDVGVVIGSGSGGLQVLEDGFHTLFEEGPKRISPFFIPTIA